MRCAALLVLECSRSSFLFEDLVGPEGTGGFLSEVVVWKAGEVFLLNVQLQSKSCGPKFCHPPRELKLHPAHERITPTYASPLIHTEYTPSPTISLWMCM